jgi:GNAT superfamily N-acetyltransferase
MSTGAGPAATGLRMIEPSDPVQLERYYELRWRLLRAPWGQPRGSERDELEERAVHLMACNPEGEAVAVGRLHFNTVTQAQVRYMAVEPSWRGRGVGRLLLRALEENARHRGADQMVLDAREAAVGFYEHCGYRAIRPAHTLFGTIRHWQMEKALQSCAPTDSVRS